MSSTEQTFHLADKYVKLVKQAPDDATLLSLLTDLIGESKQIQSDKNDKLIQQLAYNEEVLRNEIETLKVRLNFTESIDVSIEKTNTVLTFDKVSGELIKKTNG